MSQTKKMGLKGRKIECSFCGARFVETLPACPYCGSTSIKGAEAEYMEKLEDIREDMKDLEKVPLRETKKALKKQTIFALAVLGTIVGFFACLFLIEAVFGYKEEKRDPKEDYRWQQENFPLFDELYEKEDYEEMLDLYYKAYDENRPISAWEHWEFASAMAMFLETEEIWEKEANGEELSEWEYKQLLYMGFRINEYEANTIYTKEERERMAPYIENVREDFEKRWDFSQEEWERFEKEQEESGSLIPFETIDDYIEDWMERRK